MSHNAFMLVFGTLTVCSILLAWLGVLVYRAMQSTTALDRRLAHPRQQAVAGGLWPERRRRRSTGAGRNTQAFGLVVARAGSMLVPVGTAERAKLARLLRQAGFAQRDALSYFLSAKFAAALICGVSASLWVVSTEAVEGYRLLGAMAGLAGLVAGGIVPEYALRALLARRARRMSAALPDALDLMVMCLDSGLTFERALVTVADELTPIEPSLAGELRLVEAELRLSSDRRVVLLGFHQRTEVEGLRDMAMTLIQSERYGTPLTQSMKNIAANERTQRAARIEANAERLPVVMSLPMLLFVVPGTMVLVAGPAFLTAIQALGALGGS